MVVCNKALSNAIGKEPKDTYGKTDIEYDWSAELVKGNPERGIVGWEKDDLAALSGRTIKVKEEPTDFDNGIRYYDTSKFPLRDENNPIIGLVGIGRDVSERRNAQRLLEDSRKKLRNLAQTLIAAREEERKSVATRIHDVQRLSTELRPWMLEDLGLAAALKWLCEDFCRRTGLLCKAQIDLRVSGHTGAVATVIYRITQELLTNVARHAKARRVFVELRKLGRNLRPIVRDDGLGITTQQAMATESIGLIGIREQLQDLQGEFSITGARGGGTTARVRIPLRKEAPSESLTREKQLETERES